MTRPPLYTSWADYLARAEPAYVLSYCARRAKKANAERLLSSAPTRQLAADHVWRVMATVRGRCRYCGSLAVEGRPSTPNGAPLALELIGRRIGSLDHVVARCADGGNDPDNLAWCCLWCNIRPNQRSIGATDHGAIPGDSPDEESSTHEPTATLPWVRILSRTSKRTISAVTRGRTR
jgi:hypothetical protein